MANHIPHRKNDWHISHNCPVRMHGMSPFQESYWLLLVYMVNVLYLSVFIWFQYWSHRRPSVNVYIVNFINYVHFGTCFMILWHKMCSHFNMIQVISVNTGVKIKIYVLKFFLLHEECRTQHFILKKKHQSSPWFCTLYCDKDNSHQKNSLTQCFASSYDVGFPCTLYFRRATRYMSCSLQMVFGHH